MKCHATEREERIFAATVQKVDSFTFVALPFSPRAAWGAQPRFPVSGMINGLAVQGTLGVEGQNYFLRLSAAWLRASGIQIGDQVTVKLSLDEHRLSAPPKEQGRP